MTTTRAPWWADPDLACRAYQRPARHATVTDGPPPPPSDGQLVHRYRRHLGLSQRQLGEQFGVTWGRVSEWERGLDRVPARVLVALNHAVHQGAQ